MPARNRKDAAKQGKIRGFQVGDIIGVKKAGRGNTGPEWLQGTILSVAPIVPFAFPSSARARELHERWTVDHLTPPGGELVESS